MESNLEKIKKINLQKLSTFYWLVRLGSVNAAATHLHVEAYKVQNDLSALEKLAGVNLVVRNRTILTLTPFGKKLSRHASEVYDSFINLFGEEIPPESYEEIVIATTNAITRFLLPEVIAQFIDKHSKVNFKIFTGGNFMDFEALNCDMVIGFGFPNRMDLSQFDQGSCHFGFFATPEYLARKGTPKSLKELNGYDLILSRAAALALPDSIATTNRIILTATIEEPLFEFASQSRGIAFLSLESAAYIPHHLVPVLIEETRAEKLILSFKKSSPKRVLLHKFQTQFGKVFAKHQSSCYQPILNLFAKKIPN